MNIRRRGNEGEKGSLLTMGVHRGHQGLHIGGESTSTHSIDPTTTSTSVVQPSSGQSSGSQASTQQRQDKP